MTNLLLAIIIALSIYTTICYVRIKLMFEQQTKNHSYVCSRLNDIAQSITLEFMEIKRLSKRILKEGKKND